MRPIQATLLLVVATTAFNVNAAVIDDWTTPQGPFTVGVDEEITEDEAQVITPSVLGGFRTAAPVTGEDSAPGSTTTLEIGSGVFECIIDFPNMDPVNNGGGCSAAYTRGEGPVFDLSSAGAIEFEVLAADPGLSVALILIDSNLRTTNFFIEELEVGSYSAPIEGFFSLIPGPLFDETSVNTVSFSIVSVEGADGTVQVGGISTTGDIGGGPVLPTPPEVTAELIYGSYFDPARDGEGCQMTREGEGNVIVMSCYIYLNGKQAWISGGGTFSDGEVEFNNLIITSGGNYGDDFVAEDVLQEPWGTGSFIWDDCNNGELFLLPQYPGFFPVSQDYTKVTKGDCEDGPLAERLLSQGVFYNTGRDGEGFQIALQGGTKIYVITWYTYINGEQAWLSGTGVRMGNQIVFDDMQITTGAQFGPAFDPDDVIYDTWGTITVVFSDCNNAMVTTTPKPELTEIEEWSTNVTRLVPIDCPAP